MDMIVCAIVVFLLLAFTFPSSPDNRRDVSNVHLLYEDLDLPLNHYPYFFNIQTDEADRCKSVASCPYKEHLNKDVCWGYEDGCNRKNIHFYPHCSVLHKQWATDLEHQADLFWKMADFGYVKNLKPQVRICQPKHKGGSYLVCSKNLEYCKAHNIVINFSRLLNDRWRQTNRFCQDLFSDGGIGGECEIKTYNAPAAVGQSWFNELSGFTSVNFTRENCDIFVERPSFFMKMDSGTNMYHKFCDFVNLYLSQHLAGSFSKDVNIVRWDTRSLGYRDDFNFTWNAFTKHPLISLDKWKNKVVCLKDAVFTVPSRTVGGFYYNMPIIPGCHGSSFINAFSQHVLHRFRVEIKQVDIIQVTLIERRTSHRNIVNQNELIASLTTRPNVNINVLHLSRHIAFKEQLMIIYSTDILIGLHGAGLTHILFLPEGAAVFELFNCEDDSYAGLSQLRGLYYLTWVDESKLQRHNQVPHPSMGIEHPKFCDYSFDVKEFLRIFKQAENHVQQHKSSTRARDEL